jgi:hypothetical protein
LVRSSAYTPGSVAVLALKLPLEVGKVYTLRHGDGELETGEAEPSAHRHTDSPVVEILGWLVRTVDGVCPGTEIRVIRGPVEP